MTARFTANCEEVKEIMPDIEEKLFDFKELADVTLNMKIKASSEYRALNYATDLAFVAEA